MSTLLFLIIIAALVVASVGIFALIRENKEAEDRAEFWRKQHSDLLHLYFRK